MTTFGNNSDTKNMKNRNDWIILGISGATCAGKTTLSRRVSAALRGARALHQDTYFLADSDPRHTPVPGLRQPHHNYDILSALDMDKMYKDAVDIIEGRESSPAKPEKVPGSAGSGGNGCSGGSWYIPGKKLLVVEGFTVLNYLPLFELCDLRYYLTLEYAECFARRSLRLYDPPDVEGYFELCVWPEHLKYRAEIENLPNVTMLDGTDACMFDRVIADLERLGATQSNQS